MNNLKQQDDSVISIPIKKEKEKDSVISINFGGS